MTEYTIAHEFTFPSEGKVYSNGMNPNFKVRSMTTAEEMKRLNHSERPNKSMAEIMDDCLVDDIGMSAYDLCVPDYQYLLHKLRIVTYGSNYKLDITCPYCTTTARTEINLDDLHVIPFDQELFDKYSEFTLPVTGKKIKLRLQTPRILDNVKMKLKEERKKNPSASNDMNYLLTIESLIAEIDGTKPEIFQIIPFIKKLPMMDTNYLMKSAYKLNSLFGIDSNMTQTCEFCGLDFDSSFRTTAEFFGPSID